MPGESIKRKTIKGSMWSLVDNLCSQGFAFLIGIFLARLLSPSDYGTIGVLSIFILIANIFVDSGFGNALIRKKDRTHEDLSTALFFNLTVGVVVYALLFVSSPYIANFFSIPILKIVLRVLAFSILFNSLSIVHNSVLIANLELKTIAVINIFTQIPVGIISLYMAYKGYGVWTLVFQQVCSSLFKTIILWVISNWRPSPVWNVVSFRYLYDFGWKLLGANLLGTFFNEIYSFIIGRFLGSAELGYYSKSKELSSYPNSLISNIINRVVLPIMVETQGDKSQVRSVYVRMIGVLCFLSFSIFGILIVIAGPLIHIIWTDKWIETVFLFQVFCVGSALSPLSSLNFSLLQLLNRTDIMLRLEFVKKPIVLGLLLLSIPLGLKGIVVFAVIYNLIGTIINMYSTRKLLDYSYLEQFKDIAQYLLIALISVIIAYFSISIVDNEWMKIILGIIATSVVYVILSLYLKIQGLRDIEILLFKGKNQYERNTI